MYREQQLILKDYHSVVLSPLISGHYVLTGYINGKKGRFILDTGASNTCVDVELADYFSLSPEVTDEKGTGAGNNDIDLMLANDVRIRLGNRYFYDRHIALLDMSHINNALVKFDIEKVHGVIGADILHFAQSIIHYGMNRLYLHKPF